MSKDQIYIIGNWKSNKNRQEVENWFSVYSKESKSKMIAQNTHSVICPVYIHLEFAHNLIKKYNLDISLGAQDSSAYGQGAYTGEVAASQLMELVDYVIIGHSERRKYFREDDKLLEEKVNRAKEENLKVVYCLPDEKTYIPEKADIIAYEPIWAIGSGTPDSPENANQVIEMIKLKAPQKKVIYGGSVTPENIVSFISQEFIDGVLPGGASLDPLKFYEMLRKASGN